MIISLRLLTELGVRPSTAHRYLADLQHLLPEHGISTELRISHFLAQVLHESAHLERSEESLNYRAERLVQVFGRRVTAAQAVSLAGDPEATANVVYARRNGNRDQTSGDGWRYRGRGLIQLTGRGTYVAFGRWMGEDVLADPDSVATRWAVHSSVWYWTSRRLSPLADRDDIRQITRKVNGGYNGLSRRIELLEQAKAALGIRAGVMA